MRNFKIVLITLLSIIDLYFIYSTIAYIIIGIKNYPKIIGVGTSNTTFFGMYLMAITFGCLMLVFTTIIIILAVNLKKTKKQR